MRMERGICNAHCHWQIVAFTWFGFVLLIYLVLSNMRFLYIFVCLLLCFHSTPQSWAILLFLPFLVSPSDYIKSWAFLFPSHWSEEGINLFRNASHFKYFTSSLRSMLVVGPLPADVTSGTRVQCCPWQPGCTIGVLRAVAPLCWPLWDFFCWLDNLLEF